MSGRTGDKAWLLTAVAHAMCDEAARTFPLETGGVLMGYWAVEYSELVITHATGPGPKAIHGAHSFIPDYEYQEAEIARLYEESGRASTYLGDWHSHPLEGVYLSSRDKRTLRRIAKHAAARAPVPVMAVIGGGAKKWFLGVWKHSPGRLGGIMFRNGIVSLKPHMYDE
jgi:integrative and conjugative element protein (TIGR02256 family)